MPQHLHLSRNPESQYQVIKGCFMKQKQLPTSIDELHVSSSHHQPSKPANVVVQWSNCCIGECQFIWWLWHCQHCQSSQKQDVTCLTQWLSRKLLMTLLHNLETFLPHLLYSCHTVSYFHQFINNQDIVSLVWHEYPGIHWLFRNPFTENIMACVRRCT